MCMSSKVKTDLEEHQDQACCQCSSVPRYTPELEEDVAAERIIPSVLLCKGCNKPSRLVASRYALVLLDAFLTVKEVMHEEEIPSCLQTRMA